MTLPTHNFITVGIVAILALVLACGTEEDQDANQGGVAAGPTPTATAPESFPFPVVELIVGDASYPGTRGDYCWPDARVDDTVVSICAAIPAIPLEWELDERVPVPRDVNPVVEIDFSDPTISLFANFYRDPQIGSVDLVDISAKEDRVLDLSAYANDDIYLRISGNWPQGQAAYLFRLQPIPSGEALTGECFATEAERETQNELLERQASEQFESLGYSIAPPLMSPLLPPILVGKEAHCP